MSLLEPKPTLKPLRYPWAFEAWQQQQRIHWMPEEVPLADDVRDWHKKLTVGERNLLTHIFRFFTQSDTEVANCYMLHYARVFKPPEVLMMLAAFSNMEGVHQAAYSHLLDTLGLPEAEYSAFLNYEQMRAKYDYMHTFKSDTLVDIARTMAMFGAFTEGLQLFASFAILLNFTRFNKMKGMGQIIAWSARDETLHTYSIIQLFHTFIHENPSIWTPEFQIDLQQACADVVHLEDNFIDLAFELGGVQGLWPQDVKDYIRYVADFRLHQLGLGAIYGITDNPLPWMEEMLNAVEHTNFFENKATEYTRAATAGSWDEAF